MRYRALVVPVAVVGSLVTLGGQAPTAGVTVFENARVIVGDTRAPMLINLVGFGVVGIGASLLLAFRTPLGAIGLWWGFVIGLAAVAVVLVARIRVMVRRPMARVRA